MPGQLVVNEIKSFTQRLSANTDQQEIGKFMFRLAQELKKSNRLNFQPNFIPAVEEFLTQLQYIIMQPDFKTKSGFMDQFLKVMELLHNLTLAEELKGSFFSDMIRLGLSLERLSSYLRALAPILVASKVNWFN